MKLDLVRKGYNVVAQTYNKDRVNLRTGKYLNKFLQLLPVESHVLDLGCGDGLVAARFLKNGHLVTGIDFSQTQIHLAKKNCPRGEFIAKDIMDLKNGEYEVDAVISLYTIFHIPRSQHLTVLKKINSFLPKGGLLLITMGDKDFEGEHDFYGIRMWSSHWGSKKNRQLLEQAGFKILLDEIDSSGHEKHQILMAKKR